MSGLERLHEALAGGDPLLSGSLRAPAAASEAGPAALAAAGPRAAEHPREYELLVDLVYEGYLLHYAGAGRVVAPPDPDLALLLGDQLYAQGLARLAALGDLRAVTELADVISLAAQARATGDEELAEAVWTAGATAMGWGSTTQHETAKELARGGRAGAAQALLAGSRQAQDQLAPG